MQQTLLAADRSDTFPVGKIDQTYLWKVHLGSGFHKPQWPAFAMSMVAVICLLFWNRLEQGLAMRDNLRDSALASDVSLPSSGQLQLRNLLMTHGVKFALP